MTREEAIKKIKWEMVGLIIDKDARDALETLIPELRESEKPLTPFQQCLNLILRKVYFASIPNTEDINKFILDIVKNHTGELVELAKKHEYTDYQLCESEDERIRKGLIEALKTSKTVGELKFTLPEPTREKCIAYLEKQKEQKHPNGCFTCDEYKKGYEEGRRNGFTAGYNKAMKEVEQKEQKPETRDADDLQLLGFIYDLLNEIEWKDDWAMSKDECLRRLNNYRPQPKQEWSEEDERLLFRCVKSIESSKQFADSDTFEKAKDKEIDWLENRIKSIRPSWKLPEDLEEAAERYASEPISGFIDMTAYRAFIAGAGWMAKQQPLPEDSVAFQKGVQEGKRLMMEGAVDYKIVNNLAAYPVIYYEVNHLGLKYGDKVKIIIMKEV